MKKTLLILLAACALTVAKAQVLSDNVASPERLSAKAATSFKAPSSTYKPEGKPVPYIMNGFYDTPYGMMQIIGFSNTVYFADDNETVYIGSLLPRDFKTDEFWAKGKIVRPEAEGGKAQIVFDASDIAITLNEDYGTYRLHLCEFYEEGNSWKAKDLVLNYDEDGRIYIDDSEASPQRHLGLCIVDLEGNALPQAEFRCVDLKVFDKSIELTELPASATVSDYVYYGSSSFATDFAVKGRIAVDGDDYYFDCLLPEMGHRWIKGTRDGNRITLVNDQYLGNNLGYYLYYNGVERLKYNELYGNWSTTLSDLSLTVDEHGVFTIDNPQTFYPGAYTAVNYLYYYVNDLRIEPVGSDTELLTPSKPSGLELFDQYNSYGVVCLVFRQTNLTEDGKYLDPEKLGYRIYLDDEPYTFHKNQYPNIDCDFDIVPFGYSDKRADEYSDIVNRDIVWNVVNLREDLFDRVGVQAVYTVGDQTATSPIVYVYLDGHTETDGIGSLDIPAPAAPASWYDLSGRRTSDAHGLRIVGGTKVLR